MLELLKCPCCGNLPGIYQWGPGRYLCHCTRYACDFPHNIIANGKEDTIRAWNEEVIKYKEKNNEQTHSEEKDDTDVL
jgi:hypothetical protein